MMQSGASAIWAPRTSSCIVKGKDNSWSIEYMQQASEWVQIHHKYKDDDDAGDVIFVSSS